MKPARGLKVLGILVALLSTVAIASTVFADGSQPSIPVDVGIDDTPVYFYPADPLSAIAANMQGPDSGNTINAVGNGRVTNDSSEDVIVRGDWQQSGDGSFIFQDVNGCLQSGDDSRDEGWLDVDHWWAEDGDCMKILAGCKCNDDDEEAIRVPDNVHTTLSDGSCLWQSNPVINTSSCFGCFFDGCSGCPYDCGDL